MSEQPEKFCKPAGIYLLSHSVGLAPRHTRAALAENYFQPWERGTEDVWPEWLRQIESFRAALARLLSHRSDCFCPQSNVSSATTRILYSLPRNKKKSTILLTEQAFPSLGFVFEKARSSGYDVKFIGSDEDAKNPDVWSRHLTPDVGLVLITHAHSNTGEQLPVREIVDLARQSSAVSIVDIAQSVGVLPINLTEWNADFVVGSSVKWLCGGPGAGYLWVNPEMLSKCQPVDVGWFSHSDPLELDIRNFRYADDAMRFWGGTPSVLPFVVARCAIELIESIGIHTIRAHNTALCDRLIAAIDESMLVSPKSTAMRSGTVVIDPGNRAERISGQLRKAGVQFDSRPTGMRFSPHIYTTEADINTVAGLMSR